MDGFGKEWLDDMESKEDGLEIGELKQVSGQARKLIDNLRVVR